MMYLQSSNIRYFERFSAPTQQQTLLKVTKTPASTTAKRSKPSRNDVVCARGRSYWDHPGNQIYRKLIALAKNQYSKAPNRMGKSVIVSEIIDAILNSHGRFVKKVGGQGGQWAECNEHLIREKVTQSLRDGLSFKYSSSTTRKRQRKAKVQEIFHGDIDRIVHSNIVVSQKIQTLKRRVEWTNRYHGSENESVSDETMTEIFGAANLDILETIKKDRSMIDQLHHITNNNSSSCNHHKTNSEVPGTSMTTTVSTVAASAFRTVSTSSSSSSSASESESYTNNTSSASSASTSIAAAAAIAQYEHQGIECVYDDDIVLDLDSTSMFLDDIGYY